MNAGSIRSPLCITSGFIYVTAAKLFQKLAQTGESQGSAQWFLTEIWLIHTF